MELIEPDATTLERLHEVRLRGLEGLANALILRDDMSLDHALALLDDELDLSQVERVHVDRDGASESGRGKGLDPLGVGLKGARSDRFANRFGRLR